MTLQYTATHCNTLQHIATHCNTRQNAAAHCNTLQHTHQQTECHLQNLVAPQRSKKLANKHITLHHAATRCNTLQYTTTHSSTKGNAICRDRGPCHQSRTCARTNESTCSTLQHTATYCNIVYEYECNLKRSGATPSIKDMRTNKRITSATPSSSALV